MIRNWNDIPLTDRQKQVLSVLAEGLEEKAIASRLGISVATARPHKWLLYHKLGVPNAAAAVAAGFRRGLLT